MCRVICLLTAILFLCPTGALSADLSEYKSHERGWFWYEPQPVAPKPHKQKEPPPPAPAKILVKSTKPKPPTELSAEWIKANLEKYRLQAIDNPTPKNVAAYLYIQRVMLDKSQRFAEEVENVVQLDPYLDQGTRRPIAAFGGAQFSKETLAARKTILTQIAKEAGIFFFFQGGCGHCEIQAPVLKSLEMRYGFVIFPISINGQPLKNDLFHNYAMDRGQARQLHVFQTPAMFLGRPDTRAIIPLGQSTLSRDELEERILRAARDAGWITPGEYNRTRGFDASLALNLKPGEVPPNLNKEQLVEYIKKLYKQRLASGEVGEEPGDNGGF